MFDTFTQLFQQYTSEGIQKRAPQNLTYDKESEYTSSTPREKTDTEIIITSTHEEEAEILLRLYPTCKGGNLTIGLQDLLSICPRKRRRIDAFKTLRKYLKDNYSVDLHIVSRKDKFNNSKNRLL